LRASLQNGVGPRFRCIALAALLWAPTVHAQEAATPEKGATVPIPARSGSPLPHPHPFGGSDDDQRHNELVVDFDAFERFKRRIAASVRPVKARKRLAGHFDPRFAAVHHGVAFRASVGGEERWLTAGPLTEEVQDLQIRMPDGSWRRAEPGSVCEGADIAVLLPVSPDLPLGKAPALAARPPEELRELMPVLALSNLEGPMAVLDQGRLIRRAGPPLQRAWLSNLKLAPGTPLLDASGRALLVRVMRGAAVYDVPLRLDMGCTNEVKKTEKKGEGAAKGVAPARGGDLVP
jgi:hypothetical protein